MAPIRLDRGGIREATRAVAIGVVLVLAVLRRLGTPARRSMTGWALRSARRRDASPAMATTVWAGEAYAGLVDGFIELGPTFVKLGQLIASSPTVFPPALTSACERCLDQVPPISATEARRVVEEDLGGAVADLFRSFDDQPLAAASIAQVHACVLPDGREAVLKIQRPGIARQMRRDLRIMYVLARLAERSALGRTANAKGAVIDLARVTARELDSRLEARQQREFRANIHAFGDNLQVTAPEVYEPWCGPRTICMERMYGQPFDRVDPGAGIDTELVIRRVCKVWLEALTVHGPFHGDVHGGNVWLLEDGRASFLDFGIVGELSPRWRDLFRTVFRTSMIDADYVAVVRAFKEVGVLPEEADEAQLAVVVQAMFAPLLDRGLSDVGLGEVLKSLFTVLQQFGIGTPQEMLLVTKQLVYFEGYSKVLAPAYVLARDLFLVRNLFPDESRARAEQLGVTLPD